MQRGRLGDRQPRPQMDRLQGLRRRPRSAPHIAEAIRIHTRGRPASGRSAGTPGRSSINTLALVHGGGRLPLLLRLLCRRSALLGRGPARAAPDRSLHARCQRHALCHAAGLQLRATSSSPISRTASTCSTRRARRRAEDDVGRPALPARRPPWPGGGAGALSRLRAGHERRLAVAAASTSPATGRRRIRPARGRARHDLSGICAGARDDEGRGDPVAARRVGPAAAAAARQPADARHVARGGAEAGGALHRRLPRPARLRRLAQAARPRADHAPYAKREMAQGHGRGDGAASGIARFLVGGHDRGAPRGASAGPRLPGPRGEARRARHRADHRAFRARRHGLRRSATTTGSGSPSRIPSRRC